MSKPPRPDTTAHQRPHLAFAHGVSPSSQPGLWGCISDPWVPLVCFILLVTTRESWAWFHPVLPIKSALGTVASSTSPAPFLRVSPPSCPSASWGRGASRAISEKSLSSWCWLLWHAWNFILRLPRYSPRSIRVLAFPFFFDGGPFFKWLLNLLQYYFSFIAWFFGSEACGILAPQPGIKTTPPAFKGKVSITGPPGKPVAFSFQSKKHLDFFFFLYGMR